MKIQQYCVFFFYVAQQRFLNFYLEVNVQSPSDFTWSIIKQNVFHSFVGVKKILSMFPICIILTQFYHGVS